MKRQTPKPCPAEHKVRMKDGSIEARCFFSDSPCEHHGIKESCRDYVKHIAPRRGFHHYFVEGINNLSTESYRGVY